MLISNEKLVYLKKLRKEKILVISFRILLLVIFLIIWELLAQLKLINTFTFSSPSQIWNTFINLITNGNLFKHLWITIYEVLISFLLSSSIGLIISIILWRSKILAKIIDPYLMVLNSLPKVALGPLIIIWVGASINSIIFMSLLISTFITIINIYISFNNTDKSYITLMKSFKATKKQIFTKVVFPSNLENIISALKINISMNLIGVIMGELLVSKEGIGYLIMYGSQVFNINLVITGVFVLGIISYLMYYGIDKLEKAVSKK